MWNIQWLFLKNLLRQNKATRMLRLQNIFKFTLGFLTDGKGWLSYWGTCGCALLLALADVLEGFVHTLHKVITKLLDIKLKRLPFWTRFTFGYPRGLRTDGSRGDTKGFGIAQRYYQTSIVAGCDAPLDHMSSNVKLDGKDKPQYGQIGHLAMVPAKAPFRTYAGLSSTLHGESVRYGEKHEPRLKYSERSDLQAGSAPCNDSWTAVYHVHNMLSSA
ncbi:hypothetical protein IGI04_019238, partial [Brassica rapa subsp. trilocularis]